MAVKTSWAAGDVLLAADLTDTFAAKAPLASPALTGTPTVNGTAITALSGATLVASQAFSAVSTISINSCFGATYNVYVINFNITALSANQSIYARMRVSGSDDTTNNYLTRGLRSDGTTISALNSAGTEFYIGDAGTAATYAPVAEIVLFQPYTAQATIGLARGIELTEPGTLFRYRSNLYRHNVASSFTGITFYNNTGTMTGNVRIYGLKNS